jgi:peroxiredoxin
MQHLIGMRLPDVILRTSQHFDFNPCQKSGRAVYFCYPYTGRPGVENPRDWDTIKGAHGSTPQALGFAQFHEKFAALKTDVYGISLLSEEWIADFAARNSLPYLLLSDVEKQFSNALKLPRFKAGDAEFLQRLTLICDAGIIKRVTYPIEHPELNASETLASLGLL